MDTQNHHSLMVFKGEPTLTLLQQQMARGFEQKLTIDWGDYQRHHWNYLAPAMQQVTAKQMLIRNNRYPAIFKQIVHISYPKLTRLIANSNRIGSVECLIAADWPQLVELDLSNNQLVSTRSFVKMSLPTLQTLNLTSNPIVSNEHLFKADLKLAKKIEISNNQDLQEKFGISSDQVLWKVKLQKAQDSDQEYYGHHPVRGRYRRGSFHSNSSMNWSRIRQMLKNKQ